MTENPDPNEPMICPFCGHVVRMVFVHSHYQCPVCGQNAIPCCGGEQAEEEE